MAYIDPVVSKKLRLPGCFDSRDMKMASRRYSWYSFLIEAESTPGP
jgi:hypothetical protein